MLYTSENGTKISDIDSSALIEQLSMIDGSMNSYAVLEKEESGSYIQVGGGPVEYTVEMRLYSGPSTFVHQKAQLLDNMNPEPHYIVISECISIVQADEVLHLNDVQQLFLAFLNRPSFGSQYSWRDMTAQFIPGYVSAPETNRAIDDDIRPASKSGLWEQVVSFSRKLMGQ